MSWQLRFWRKVTKTESCWLWTGYRDLGGYGRAVAEGGRVGAVHRLSFALAYGPIPQGLQVCHKCDVRNCVNPDHHFLGTHSDNMSDMHRKGRNRQPKGEAHNKAKLTEAAVREIRASGLGPTALARAYGVTKSTIKRIRNGTGWRHV